MSNILIIKHGSLGDIIQANGAMKDIKQNFPNDKVLLTNYSSIHQFDVILSIYKWSID